MSETTETATQGGSETAIAADQTDTSSATAQDTSAQAETEQATDEPKTEDPPKKKAWWDKVIAEKAHAEREAKREAAYWRSVAQQSQQGQQGDPSQAAQNGQAQAGFIPVADLPKYHAQIAETMQFHTAADAIADAGQAYPDFTDALTRLMTLGVDTQNPRDPLMQIVTALGPQEGAAAFRALGNDPDEAMRITRLPLARMAVEVARLAAKPAAPKPVSKVPPPIAPIAAARVEPGSEPDAKRNPEAWNKWFLEKRRNR